MTAAPIRFDDQVAIVTGAGGGIGRATALLLAARGASLVINDPAEGLADAVVEQIVAAGGRAVAERSAVGAPDTAAAIVGAAVDSFGRLDILVNNAGISRPAKFGDDSDDDIAAVFAVNLLGPYALMRAAWPVMRAQAYGRILNTASSAAMGSGFSGAYAPTKAGVIGLTKEAGICGRPLGILVNGLMPTAYTPLLEKHPDPAFRAWMRRHFRPEQVAALSAFLVSRDNQASSEMFTAGGGTAARVAFLRSQGLSDPVLSPELVRDGFDNLCMLDEADALVTQEDLQAIYFRQFPMKAAT